MRRPYSPYSHPPLPFSCGITGGRPRRIRIIYVRQKRQLNRLHDAFHISIDIRIRKPRYPITEFIQLPIASYVASPIPIEAMLHVIYFDDQPSSTAFEIHDP